MVRFIRPAAGKRPAVMFSTAGSKALASIRRAQGRPLRLGPKVMAAAMRAQHESGFVDLALAVYAYDTTGSITLLNTVAQGASVSQRVGKKIALQSIQVRGMAYNNAAATFNDCATLLVYDKRPTGALPAITDVLNTASSQSFNNDTNSGRFRIVRRWDQALVGGTVVATTPITALQAVSMDNFVNLKGMNVVYKAAGTGAIADIEEGALYLITVGMRAAGTTAAAADLGFRLRYKE